MCNHITPPRVFGLWASGKRVEFVVRAALGVGGVAGVITFFLWLLEMGVR